MPVELDNRVGGAIDEAAVAEIVGGVLAAEGADGELAVILVDAPAIRELNRAFRGRDAVTDVLSFPIDEGDPLPDGVPRMLGDVVVCLEQAQLQAAEQGLTPGEELTTLIVHGVLHLLGHDHESDAGEMLALQDRLVNGLEAEGHLLAWDGRTT